MTIEEHNQAANVTEISLELSACQEVRRCLVQSVIQLREVDSRTAEDVNLKSVCLFVSATATDEESKYLLQHHLLGPLENEFFLDFLADLFQLQLEIPLIV